MRLSGQRLNKATSKKTYGPTAAQNQWQRDHERKQTDYTRWKCTWLKFWQTCRNKACRRHKRCSGDARACWQEQWPSFPPILKEQLKLAIKFMNEGLPQAEAFSTAKTTLLRELEEQIAQAEQEARDVIPATRSNNSASCGVDSDVDAQLANSIQPPTPRVRLA
jgi:hypothetical protein